VLVRFNQSNIKKVNNINLTGPAPNCYATPNFFRSPSGLLFLQLPGLDVAVLRPIHPLKEDVVAFRVEGVGIALQDERFVGHLVNRLDQVRIDGVSSLGIGGVWKEHLLAINLVVGDCSLSLWRHQPVDKRLSKLCRHVWMLVGVHQNDAVLIEHAPVAFTAVLMRNRNYPHSTRVSAKD